MHPPEVIRYVEVYNGVADVVVVDSSMARQIIRVCFHSLKSALIDFEQRNLTEPKAARSDRRAKFVLSDCLGGNEPNIELQAFAKE
jgi:hypothetical protein